MSIGFRPFMLLLVTLLQLPAEVNFPAPRPPTNDVRLENHVPIPMRDGVVLYADVYRPCVRGSIRCWCREHHTAPNDFQTLTPHPYSLRAGAMCLFSRM